MNVEVDVLDVRNSPHSLCGPKATLNCSISELRSCVNVEVDVLDVRNSPHSLCGPKATLNCSISELKSCVNVQVAVLGSPSLIVLMVFVDVKQL